METHSFIVRVWREAREIDAPASEWRAMIEQVQAGGKRYVVLGQGSPPPLDPLCALLGSMIQEQIRAQLDQDRDG